MDSLVKQQMLIEDHQLDALSRFAKRPEKKQKYERFNSKFLKNRELQELASSDSSGIDSEN